MSTVAKVAALPKCDFCANKAGYDGATKMGPWAYMCEMCFSIEGRGLGTGIGQRLVVEGEDVVMSYGELAELTHKTQVELFGFCTCEDGEKVYEDCNGGND
jgi:hypothetical protein